MVMPLVSSTIDENVDPYHLHFYLYDYYWTIRECSKQFKNIPESSGKCWTVLENLENSSSSIILEDCAVLNRI